MRGKRNRKIRRAITILLTLLAVLGFSTCLGDAAESFETKSFDVEMTVQENNSFLIDETIQVNFTEPRHGIYLYIPDSGETTRQENGTIITERYRMKITDVTVDGYDFETYHENENLVIQIGSADYLIDGQQEYHVSYRCAVYDDENIQSDSLYFNLLPVGWKTPIESSNMVIHMPKPFDPGNAEFIAGGYGGVDMKAVDWSAADTTITANLTRVLDTGEGVTLKILLPEGYFAGGLTTSWMLWLMLILIIAAPVFSILLWFLFGRDPKVVKTVEFYPPDGVSPAELGYIIDGFVDSKDMVSLIIYWANQGYLEIREEGKEQYVLIKKKDLPEDAKTYEYTMFNGLFEDRDQVSPEDLKEDFYGTFEASKGQLKAWFTLRKENRIFTQSSVGARAVGILLMMVPFLALALLGVGYSLADPGWILLSVPILLLSLAGFSMMILAFDRKDGNSKKKTFAMNLAGIILAGLAAFFVLLFSYFAISNILLGVCAILASLISLTFTIRMKQRTKSSSRLLGKILGFKEFIRSAELDRIKLLVEETPDYFYHVLPYAYVFGLTDKWAKKFEALAVEPPAWYGGSYGGSMFNTWIFMNSFHHYTHAIQHNISIPPAPSGGGGGGFSAGGGFSGGGMGGGGGGSW